MDQIARTPAQIGAAIQRARRLQQLSQTALADRAGLRQELVSKIESGRAVTRIGTICDILAALNLELTIGTRSTRSSADLEDIF